MFKTRFRLPENYFASVAPVVDTRQHDIRQFQKIDAQLVLNAEAPRRTPVDIKPDKEVHDLKISKHPEKFFNAKRIGLSIIAIILLLVSVTAVITLSVLYTEAQSIPKVSNYGDSCLSIRCNQTGFLSCIDGICQCNDFELKYYNPSTLSCVTKSILQRNHGEECLFGTTKCLNGTACLASRCQCNSTIQYWNGSICMTKKEYNQVCVNRNTTNSSPYYLTVNCVDSDECVECSPSSLLICATTNRCGCPSSMYYYGSTLKKCLIRQSYFSSCTLNSQCDSTIGLSCITTTTPGDCPTISAINRCDCQNTSYYDYSLGKCNLKKGYYRPCNIDCECDSSKNLKCYNQYCTCQPYLWYSGSTCTAQKTYGQSCTNHIECRFDKGLTCLNSLTCSCANPTQYYWDSSKQRCVECPAGWNLLLINGVYRCFLLSSNKVLFNKAHSICRDFAANLAEIRTTGEYAALVNLMIIDWYWVGIHTVYCDGVGTWNWRYLTDNAAVNFALLPPWYTGVTSPRLHCDYVYLLVHPNGFIINSPDYAPSLHNFICEM